MKFLSILFVVALLSIIPSESLAQSKSEIQELAKELEYFHQKAKDSWADLKESTLKYRASLNELLIKQQERESTIREEFQKTQAMQEGALKEEALKYRENEWRYLQRSLVETTQRIAEVDKSLREIDSRPQQKVDFMAEARKILAERKKAERTPSVSRRRTTVVVIVGMLVIEDYGPRQGRVFKSRSGQVLASSRQ